MKKGFGDLFGETINEYRKKFLSILKIFLFLYVIPLIAFMIIIVILAILIFSVSFQSVGNSILDSNLFSLTGAVVSNLTNPEISPILAGQISPTLLIIFIVFVIILFLTLVYFLLLNTISILLVGFSKKELLFNEIFRNARKYFWKYLGLTIVFFIFLLGLFLLLIIPGIIFWKYLGLTIVFLIFLLGLFLLLIIPGIIFLVYWIFSNYILINEKTSIMQSLKRSKEIVKGRWWGVFGYLILIIIIYMGSSLIISFIPIVNLIASPLVLMPFLVLFLKNFYLDLKANPC